jgi:CTP:molybdopterin cytidylyltransferase MocA
MVTKISLVCLAAGMSKRFGGELKQLAKVGPNNETLIECILNQAITAGFDKIMLQVQRIPLFFLRFTVTVRFSDTILVKTIPWGSKNRTSGII